MAKYRFPCPQCGHVAIVSEDQAGAESRCAECGAKASLPTLMQMRRLEPADSHPARATDPKQIDRTRRRRGLGAGLFTIGLLMLLIGGGGSLSFWYVRERIEIYEVNQEALAAEFDAVREMSAADAYRMWEIVRDRELDEQPRMTPLTIASREQHAAMGTAIVVCLALLALGALLLIAGGWALLSTELRSADAD
jgi:DNA-directed RNA polymerase subunit RPC12/RpoP